MEHLHDFGGGGGQERSQQGRADHDALCQVVEDCGQTVFFGFIPGKDPGLSLVDVFVEPLEDAEDLGQGVRYTQLVHLGLDLVISGGHDCLEVIIYRLGSALVGYDAAKVFVGHGDGPVDQIAEGIGQIGVDTLCDQFPGDDAVVLIGHLMDDEITGSVHAENVRQVIRVDHVALGLGHLLAALQQPGMAEDLLGKGLAQGHQEDGPVNGMEADDVLADQVEICGPVLFVQVSAVAVGVIADAGDVVAERVQPYIDDMAGIEIHRDAPLEGSPGYAQVLQAGQKEVVHHLVLSGNGLDELRMGIDMVDQTVRVFLHFEEVGLFSGRVDFAAADGALVLIDDLGSGIEGFTLCTVQAFIMSFINIALLIEAAEDLLDLNLMVRVCRTDKSVIGCIHQVPEALDLGRVLVYELLGCHAGPVGAVLDLLTVFVRTGLEVDIIAVCPFVAGDGVRQNDLVAVADVGLAGCVGDRRCNVVFTLVLHNI